MLLLQRPKVNNNFTEASSEIDAQEYLRDWNVKGKEKPWRVRKATSRKVARAFECLGPEHAKRADRMRDCASILDFETVKKGSGVSKRLVGGRFCKERLCPVCQSGRSRKMQMQLSEVVTEAVKRFPKDIAVLMTLTVPNCDGHELKHADKFIKRGLKTFIKSARMQHSMRGFFWSMEVSFNAQTGLYHPHVHMLALMRPEYAAKGSKLYFDQRKDFEFSRFWGECLGMKSTPIADIRPVKGVGKGQLTTEGRKSLYEVTKYCVKPDALLEARDADLVAVVKVLHEGLRGASLYRYGGEFAKIRRELKQTDELVDADFTEGDDELPKGAKVLGKGRFRYDVRLREYVFSRAWDIFGREVDLAEYRSWETGSGGADKGGP